MNFNKENPMLLSGFLACERASFVQLVPRVCNTGGRKLSNFAAFLPLVLGSARAQNKKPPCITMGVCIFGRYKLRDSVIGGGF
jgi:hypothetical protein